MDESEHRAEGGGSVQVVGQGGGEGSLETRHDLFERRFVASLLRLMGESKAHVVDPLESPVRLRHLGEGEVELLPVVNRDQQVADRTSRQPSRFEIGKCVAVAQGLGHLVAVDGQVLRVEPVPSQRAAVRGLALGDLVLVMRKQVVDPSAVNVEGCPQVLLAHRGALDVPPRTTGPPG